MPKFYIDFTGWCEIEAETPERAKEKFWELIMNDQPLPSNYYFVGEIEEKKD